MSIVLAGKSCHKMTVTTISQWKSKETKATCGARTNADATTDVLVIHFYRKVKPLHPIVCELISQGFTPNILVNLPTIAGNNLRVKLSLLGCKEKSCVKHDSGHNAMKQD